MMDGERSLEAAAAVGSIVGRRGRLRKELHSTRRRPTESRAERQMRASRVGASGGDG